MTHANPINSIAPEAVGITGIPNTNQSATKKTATKSRKRVSLLSETERTQMAEVAQATERRFTTDEIKSKLALVRATNIGWQHELIPNCEPE